ncbi:MAG: hypothetical protein QW182_06435 [Thermosphaera sp.]
MNTGKNTQLLTLHHGDGENTINKKMRSAIKGFFTDPTNPCPHHARKPRVHHK